MNILEELDENLYKEVNQIYTGILNDNKSYKAKNEDEIHENIISDAIDDNDFDKEINNLEKLGELLEVKTVDIDNLDKEI